MNPPAADSASELENTSDVKLNWLDKTVWALAKQTGDEHPFNIIAMKAVIGGSLGVNIAFMYRLLWKVLEVIDFSLPSDYWFVFLVFAVCYIPIHVGTHSASEIAKLNLPTKERRVYTALGLFLALSWGVHAYILIYLESG
jgi:uncharacterized protein YacL